MQRPARFDGWGALLLRPIPAPPYFFFDLSIPMAARLRVTVVAP